MPSCSALTWCHGLQPGPRACAVSTRQQSHVPAPHTFLFLKQSLTVQPRCLGLLSAGRQTHACPAFTLVPRPLTTWGTEREAPVPNKWSLGRQCLTDACLTFQSSSQEPELPQDPETGCTAPSKVQCLEFWHPGPVCTRGNNKAGLGGCVHEGDGWYEERHLQLQGARTEARATGALAACLWVTVF